MIDIDGNWAWLVLLAAVVANVLSGGIIYSYGVLYNDIRDRMESSSAETAAVGALCLACFFFVVPLGRCLCQRIGYRWTTIIGALVQSVGLVASAFVPTVHFYFITLGILAGCGGGLIYAGCFAAINDYFERRLDIATGLVYCGTPFGVFLFAMIIHHTLNTYAYFGTFILLCGAILNCIVCGVIFKPLVYSGKTKPGETSAGVGNGIDGERGDASADIPGASADGEDDSVEDEGDYDDDEKSGFGKVKKIRYKAAELKEESFTFSTDDTVFKLPAIETTEETEEYESDIEEPVDSAARPDRQKPDRPERDPESAPAVPESKPKSKSRKAALKATVTDMIGLSDVSRQCQCDFVLFLIAVLFFSFGASTPYFLFPDYLRERGGNELQAAGTLSCIGIAATVGVELFWFLAMKLEPGYERTSILLALTTTLVSGLSVVLIRYYLALFAMFLCAVFFGFLSAAFHPLKQKMIVSIWGEENLLSGLTLSYWVAGVGSSLGSPLAGYLRDCEMTYTWSFVMAAVSLCVCSLVTLPLLFMSRERHKYVRDAI